MSFLGVGYQELLLVLVLMLVVVGPERLPGMAYQIGKAVRTLQGYARQVRDEFQDEISYIEDQYKTVKGEVDSARESMRAETSRLDSEMRDATAALRNDPLAIPSTSSWVGEVPQSNVVSISDGQPIVPSTDVATDTATTIVESTSEGAKPAPLVF